MSTITVQHPDLARPFPIKPRPTKGSDSPQAYFLQTDPEEEAEVVIMQPDGQQTSMALEDFHNQFVPTAQGDRGTRIRAALKDIFGEGNAEASVPG